LNPNSINTIKAMVRIRTIQHKVAKTAAAALPVGLAETPRCLPSPNSASG